MEIDFPQKDVYCFVLDGMGKFFLKLKQNAY